MVLPPQVAVDGYANGSGFRQSCLMTASWVTCHLIQICDQPTSRYSFLSTISIQNLLLKGQRYLNYFISKRRKNSGQPAKDSRSEIS